MDYKFELILNVFLFFLILQCYLIYVNNYICTHTNNMFTTYNTGSFQLCVQWGIFILEINLKISLLTVFGDVNNILLTYY